MAIAFTNPNYGKQLVALQRAREEGRVRITTDEAGLVVARYGDSDNILISYNHPAEICSVQVYDGLDLLENHNTSEPLELAAKLCEKYQTA